MNAQQQDAVVLDTSVLINFLAINQCALLASHPIFRFVITAHVATEITYPTQSACLSTAICNNHLSRLLPGDHAELVTFAQLTTTLGVGESAAIAAAVHRGFHVALEDRAARTRAESLVGRTYLLNTQQLMVGLIRAGEISISDADAIKNDWQNNHRFVMPGFQSFADLIAS